MTASVSSIRSSVKTLVDAVSNIGQTHDYFRWARDNSDLLDVIKTTISSTDQIRVWMLTVYGPSDVRVAGSRGYHRKRYEIELHGYLGLDDSAATEKTMAGLAEDVVEKLEQYPTLSGTITDGWYESDGMPAIVAFEHRMFAGHLCHHVLITAAFFEKSSVTYTLS